MLPTSGPPQNKRPTQTEVKSWKKNIPCKQTGKKKAGVALLISDKIHFKTKAIKRVPEGHFITLKGRYHQQDINITNILCTQHRSTQIHKEIMEDFKKYIDSNTIIVQDFNIPLSKMD